MPPHWHERAPRSWQRAQDPWSLLALEPTPAGGALRAQRDPRSGALMGFTEELLPFVGLSAQNSLSLRRPPGPPGQPPQGSATNVPFWPGGLEEPTLEQIRGTHQEEEDIDFETDLLTTPPGLQRGVEYKPPVAGPGGPVSLSSLLGTLDVFELVGDKAGGGPQPPRSDGGGSSSLPPLPPRRADSLEELLKEEQGPPPAPPEPPQEVWAELLDADTPVEGFEELVPDPAFKWPFSPDPFQQRAVLALERGHSLLVAAHTSAGKTAVAEYAVALARRHMTRSIYTSPIKALSNQKFRDFKATFGDVGLLTGDVQLHPEASCLIMTTEILRSMLYNGSDIIRDLEWVIFDEVHYINDAERGVVWEEVLIMLPEHVKLILLSATVPNALEFAQWVGRTKGRILRVLSTRARPVPLQHFLFTGPRHPTLHLLLDAQGGFCTRGYYAAMEAKKEQSSKHAQSFGAKQPNMGGSPGQEQGLWLALLRLLQTRSLLPVVAFTFSRGRCWARAQALGGLDLLSPPERSHVRGFVHKCLGRLGGPDRRLPQVLSVSELLQRGIGLHHGGVLPLLKEMVEMLFSQGLVKVLFATETFAMGVNMPARTVVFDSIRKHDGNSFRDLLPGEYVQMSGRAGRRGLDSTGTVIILCPGALPELADLHRVVLGRPAPLQSQFRLTYPMILGLLRAQALRVQDVMRSSFAEFPLRRDAPVQQRRVAELRAALAALGEPDLGGPLEDLPLYHRAATGLRRARAVLTRRLAESPAGLRVLAPGRVVVVCTPRHRNALGLILQVTSEGPSRTFTTLVLSDQPPEGGGTATDPPLPPDVPYPEDLLLTHLFLPEGPCGYMLEKLQPGDIGGVTTKTLRVNPEKLLQELSPPPGSRARVPSIPLVGAALQELARLAGGVGGVPLLEPPLRDPPSLEAATTTRTLAASLSSFQCVHSPRFPQQYSQFAARQELLEQLEELQFQLSDQSLLLLPEYQQRLEVLRALGYVERGDTVALGGRVASLLSCHQLLLTELLLGNVLAPLNPQEAAALLGCLGGGPGRGGAPENLTPPLQQALQQLLALAQRLAQLQQKFGIPESPEEPLDCSLVPVVYEWARGMPFADIVLLAGVQEGSLVRAIQRLEEMLRELRGAARLLGEPALAAKLESASSSIRRDIVFAASLYTQ
ncbi:SKI2 subunit of superkiller complex protein [Apus apus]|uniref:SKI2 subunit of superkiller complex protein n=1 Tax=Apus apus TaxID=8895 RepID=UPI0021F81A18|nr:SKI2 subunit of superkiller complex protein [Apus apus]